MEDDDEELKDAFNNSDLFKSGFGGEEESGAGGDRSGDDGFFSNSRPIDSLAYAGAMSAVSLTMERPVLECDNNNNEDDDRSSSVSSYAQNKSSYIMKREDHEHDEIGSILPHFDKSVAQLSLALPPSNSFDEEQEKKSDSPTPTTIAQDSSQQDTVFSRNEDAFETYGTVSNQARGRHSPTQNSASEEISKSLASPTKPSGCTTSDTDRGDHNRKLRSDRRESQTKSRSRSHSRKRRPHNNRARPSVIDGGGSNKGTKSDDHNAAESSGKNSDDTAWPTSPTDPFFISDDTFAAFNVPSNDKEQCSSTAEESSRTRTAQDATLTNNPNYRRSRPEKSMSLPSSKATSDANRRGSNRFDDRPRCRSKSRSRSKSRTRSQSRKRRTHNRTRMPSSQPSRSSRQDFNKNNEEIASQHSIRSSSKRTGKPYQSSSMRSSALGTRSSRLLGGADPLRHSTHGDEKGGLERDSHNNRGRRLTSSRSGGTRTLPSKSERRVSSSRGESRIDPLSQSEHLPGSNRRGSTSTTHPTRSGKRFSMTESASAADTNGNKNPIPGRKKSGDRRSLLQNQSGSQSLRRSSRPTRRKSFDDVFDISKEEEGDDDIQSQIDQSGLAMQ